MSAYRIALANLHFPSSSTHSVTLAVDAIAQASTAGVGLVCFPECFVPGYRSARRALAPPDATFLSDAWSKVADAARAASIAVVLGTERVVQRQLLASALVINADGTIAGFQDKVQIDPSEDSIYTAGEGRHVFHAGALTFGVAICHEGWRYPETVRWAARHGAHVVFHPQFHEAEPGSHRPSTYAEQDNSFHEKAAMCRAAENTVFFATVNYASEGSPTTSAVIRPDGTVQCYQPYGVAGLLVADLDLSLATGLLASRYRPLLA